eukprot:GFKZ01010300.1.p1 GENE.GFKZ01010300.1~~GFKZ01010300.1.p1  ORF type:complete len:477 (-),score=55.07 GFKZ01010300.1:3702-5132(-)
MTTARRSERLRRKRQTTPGLSQPGAYSLYGSGYVVESDASFLPPPQNPRRSRYQNSPHILAEDQSSPITRDKAAQRAQTSLFDILGSAARRPVHNAWPAFRTAAKQWRLSDPNQSQSSPQPKVTRTLDRQFETDPHPAQSPPSVPPRLFTPLALWILLLVLAAPTLLVLESHFHNRLPYFVRTGRQPVLTSLAQTPSLPGTQYLTAVWITMQSVFATIRTYVPRSDLRPSLRKDQAITRSDLDAIIPDVLAEARKAAVEEVNRVTNRVDAGAGAAVQDFSRFVEKYAADKGLPADYALRSAGGSIAAASPSTVGTYAKFARKYVEALFSDKGYSPVLPRRAVAVLEPDVLPGNCWAFEGETGSVTIRLARPVEVGMVTVEHTPERSVFSTLSAPRRFRIWGVPLGASRAAVGEWEMVQLGEFVFEMEEGKRHLQTFLVEGKGVMRAVRFEFLSNHGGQHTSVYRLRVHGKEVEMAM